MKSIENLHWNVHIAVYAHVPYFKMPFFDSKIYATIMTVSDYVHITCGLEIQNVANYDDIFILNTNIGIIVNLPEKVPLEQKSTIQWIDRDSIV